MPPLQTSEISWKLGFCIKINTKNPVLRPSWNPRSTKIPHPTTKLGIALQNRKVQSNHVNCLLSTMQ